MLNHANNLIDDRSDVFRSYMYNILLTSNILRICVFSIYNLPYICLYI